MNVKNKQEKEKPTVLDIMVPQIFPLLKIADMDLVIVLANCLDNAIEAVEQLGKTGLRRIKVVILK